MKKVYHLLKGDYLNQRTFSLVKLNTENPRYFQIGYAKKFKIREIMRLKLLDKEDEYKL